jgi:hypothetical protein
VTSLLGDDVVQEVLRLDADELAGRDQRSSDGPVLTATGAAGKGSDPQMANGVLRNIGICLELRPFLWSGSTMYFRLGQSYMRWPARSSD